MSLEYDLAVKLLQSGELVAFPTETVYGLGADAANPDAVARIFAAKGRPANHPVIVHLAGAGQLDQWARDIPPVAWELAEAFWPGPLTLILKRAPAVPLAVTGGQDTVGVRVPAHPVALDLLRAYAEAGGGRGGLCGIAAPSANRFGRISPTDAAHVRDELGDAVALVLDGGRCPVGIESTIIDLSNDNGPLRLLRPGHITPEQIRGVVGVAPESPGLRKPQQGTPRVSGSLDAHYAPRTPMRVVDTAQLRETLAALSAAGKRFGLLVYSSPDSSASAHSLRQMPNDPEGYARELYAALRDLDAAGNELIVVERIPESPAWAAVNDRLRRAACGAGNS
ncbi:L-threonylcarbamoyladenylate synthase [Propionivibrio soli]|uniref:L-threonylcarbamoyladenylate synthase n=1 Tax=Propionivibrio soli TaxID=2976531 RepID=UPI0021E7EA66|nr:L-threonylcarbamoyladenylate synthase [Propionivibrio soli]